MQARLKGDFRGGEGARIEEIRLPSDSSGKPSSVELKAFLGEKTQASIYRIAIIKDVLLLHDF